VLGNIPYGQIILEKAVLGLPKSIGYCGGHTLPSSLSHFFLAISSKVAFTITLGWWLFIALPLNVLDAWPNESSATGDQEWFAMAASRDNKGLVGATNDEAPGHDVEVVGNEEVVFFVRERAIQDLHHSKLLSFKCTGENEKNWPFSRTHY